MVSCWGSGVFHEGIALHPWSRGCQPAAAAAAAATAACRCHGGYSGDEDVCVSKEVSRVFPFIGEQYKSRGSAALRPSPQRGGGTQRDPNDTRVGQPASGQLHSSLFTHWLMHLMTIIVAYFYRFFSLHCHTSRREAVRAKAEECVRRGIKPADVAIQPTLIWVLAGPPVCHMAPGT
ncbi:hypothetical protein E2C01_063250 [Portunus trituberculatus]|uniref:Uncharacterized protein n=1 Tax=Portunus trituberculatus TaxID=210409 RepID=A0A5B7HIG5_PORTR|nr:hypothetical protein [Portunus trituberculatus]